MNGFYYSWGSVSTFTFTVSVSKHLYTNVYARATLAVCVSIVRV